METTFDYIIVGAGSAGCVLANRLTANGKHTVLLLEAGPPDKSFWIKLPMGISKILSSPGYAWFDPTLATQSFGGRSLILQQGRTLGGGSSVNGMLYVRGQDEDFDGWREAGCPGWGWDDVLPYFKKSENLESGGKDEHHGRTGPLKLSWMHGLPELSSDAMEACKEYGLPFNPDINSGNQDGVGYLLATIHKGRRQSTAKAFLHPVKNQRQNLTVKTNSPVRKIIVNDGRATAITVESPEGQVEYKARREIILSAGAIGTPHILQHSGIGDANHLKSVGIEPVLDSSEVGQNLQDHLFGHIKFKVKDKKASINYKLASNPRMAFEALKWLISGRGELARSTSHFCGFIKSNEELDRSNLQLAMRPWSFHLTEEGVVKMDSSAGMTFSAIQTRPYSRGTVKVLSNNPMERAQVDTAYLADERDTKALIEGMHIIREIAKQPALSKHIAEEMEPGPASQTYDDMKKHLHRTSSTVYHPVGTVRMGSDEKAPLTPELKLRGIDGLRVADASIMPRITSGNTNAPSIMIGEKASDMILADAMLAG